MEKNILLVPEFREYLRNDDTAGLREFCDGTHPGILAEFLTGLETAEIADVLRRLEPRFRAAIFSEFPEELQAEIVKNLPREEVGILITEMSHDDRVDFLKRLPSHQAEDFVSLVAQAEREDIKRLSAYPEGTTGAMMTTEYATLRPDITAAEAISRLRQEAPNKETIYYIYIVDEARRLLGFVSLKALILAKPETRVTDIMHTDILSVRAHDDQEKTARTLQKYDLIAIPVTDENGVLLGIVTHDDAFDVIIQEQTEDMEKLMAIGGKHAAGTYMKTSPWVHLKSRCGWIVALAAMGLISGSIVQGYESLLMQFAILATFMPMLADTGGNTGSQSATLVIRALALGEIGPKDLWRVVWKEFWVALPLGGILALFAYGRVLLFAGDTGIPAGFPSWRVGLAVGIALILQVVSSTLIGAVLPIFASRLKFDPAVVASPAITTIVDISGLFLFFSTSKIILGV